MCLQGIKIAKSQEVRSTSQLLGVGATAGLGGLANNRVYARFGLALNSAAISNVVVFVYYLQDSVQIGLGALTAGYPFLELWLERHSHIVKGPFQVFNNSGAAATIGLSELLQNTNPEDALK